MVLAARYSWLVCPAFYSQVYSLSGWSKKMLQIALKTQPSRHKWCLVQPNRWFTPQLQGTIHTDYYVKGDPNFVRRGYSSG